MKKSIFIIITVLLMFNPYTCLLYTSRTHTTERIRPSRTKTILAPAQAVRTPSGSERCRSDGARAASGRMLTCLLYTSPALLNTLKSIQDVEAASTAFLTQYEKPANIEREKGEQMCIRDRYHTCKQPQKHV